MAPILPILWSFRTPIAIGVALLAGWGALKWYGHTKYEEGRKEVAVVKAELKQAREDWSVEVLKWNKMVDNQSLELEKAKREKEEIVARNLKEFFERKKAEETNRSKREDEIKANIKPTDTIVVPSVFERLYNDTVKGSHLANGDSGNIQVPKDRPSTLGETKTFDATAFTQVIIRNLGEYNSLALRCSKLIDVVIELETKYGVDFKGPEGTSVSDGGNISTGAAGDHVPRPSG